MYLVPLKALLVRALKVTFDSAYPQSDFRSINAGIEYPVDKQSYPGIWVDYSDTEPLRQAGVSHRETDATTGALTENTRFKFAGTASFTIVALSSLERDRLFDELIRVMAFGTQDTATRRFRDTLETNDLLAVNGKFDEIEVSGNASAPGTPWGSEEIIYERTISIDLLGEFLADPVAGTLVPLSAIHVTSVVDTNVDQPIAPATPVTDGLGAWI